MGRLREMLFKTKVKQQLRVKLYISDFYDGFFSRRLLHDSTPIRNKRIKLKTSNETERIKSIIHWIEVMEGLADIMTDLQTITMWVTCHNYGAFLGSKS